MAEYTVIHFALDKGQGQTGDTIAYRPWSTRSLKVQLTTAQDLPALRLRPRALRAEESKKGIFRGFADDSDDFIISWGGGHEAGPCVRAEDFLMAFERPAPLPAGQTSMLYLNLTHVGPGLPNRAVVTLEAYEEESGRVYASLAVPLSIPTQFPQATKLIRLEDDGQGSWSVTSGSCLPVCESRWWPSPDVTYQETTSPPMSIRKQDNQIIVQWQDKPEPTAIITDNTKSLDLLYPTAFSLELSHFDEWSVALRVWFFWVDTNIGGRFFIGRHEVPDAERFDIIIRRQDGRALMACTDLHWREVWGEVIDRTFNASIGFGRNDQVAALKKGIDTIWDKVARREKSHQEIYDPLEGYVRKRAAQMAKETLRRPGTQAHIPVMQNVEQLRPEKMTSSDVRLG